jgi:uncharacterized protein YbbC (DUF1343 family)
MAIRTLKQAALFLILAAGCQPLATPAGAAQVTLTGLDVLERNDFDLLKGKRVGIITNHSSVNAAGRNAVIFSMDRKR